MPTVEGRATNNEANSVGGMFLARESAARDENTRINAGFAKKGERERERASTHGEKDTRDAGRLQPQF